MESIALLISQLFPPHTITEKHATYITVVAYNYSEEKHGINSFINESTAGADASVEMPKLHNTNSLYIIMLVMNIFAFANSKRG